MAASTTTRATAASTAAAATDPADEAAFLDPAAFDALANRLKQNDEQREAVIKRSRDVQKAAKQTIFALHRGDAARASALLRDAALAVRSLQPIVAADATLRHGGSFTSALEELCEAYVFKGYLETGRVPPPQALQRALASEAGEQEGREDREAAAAAAAAAGSSGLELTPDEYLGGVLDFAGELNRHAISKATARDSAAVRRARDCVEALLGRFLALDLRNGNLRKKYDGLKYVLRNLEATLYDLTLAESTGRALALAAAGAAGAAADGGGGQREQEEGGGRP
jgi:predicted translin family RNA/ssDNA-binding protein